MDYWISIWEMPRTEGELKSDRLRPEVAACLYRLGKLKLVSEQLKTVEGTITVNPWESGLDLAFQEKMGGEGCFVGVELFGRENVVGVVVAGEVRKLKQRISVVEDKVVVMDVELRGGVVVGITEADLANWLAFYQQIEAEDWREKVGNVVLQYSGLERMESEAHDIVSLGWDRLKIETEERIDGLGLKWAKGESLDEAFVDAKGEQALVPVFHVRMPQMQENIMMENVLSEAVQVPGVVIRKEQESKRELYERALTATLAYREKYGREDIVVPAVGKAQIELWRNLGMFDVLSPNVTETGITNEQLARYLFLGKSNLDPGPLSKKGYSMPGRGDLFSFPGVDLIFTKMSGGLRKVTPVDNFAVFDKHGKVVPLSNVVGAVIYGPGMTFEEMKTKTETVRRDIAYRSGVPGGFLLFATPELFKFWQEQGSPFFQGNIEAIPGVDAQKRNEYVMPMRMDKAFYFEVHKYQQIGGKRSGIKVMGPEGNSLVHLIDWGASFTESPDGLEGLGKQPPTADALLRLLRTTLPMKPNMYFGDYLLATAMRFPGLANRQLVTKDPVASYLVSEMYGMLKNNEAELEEKLPADVMQIIRELGPRNREIWGADQVKVLTATLSHFHADHAGLYPYLSDDIRAIVSGPSRALMQASSNKAGSWRRKFMNRVLITEPKVGAAYQTAPVDISPYYFSGQRIPLSGADVMTPYFVDHSVDGGVWQYHEIQLNGGQISLLDTGDWRVDKEGKIWDIAHTLAGKVDVMVTEATNFGSEKLDEGKTETDVRRTLEKVFSRSKNEALIVVAPINNFERMQNIYEAGKKAGRKVAFSYSHAEMEMQLQAAKQIAPMGAEGFGHVLPVEFGNDGLSIWAKRMTSQRMYQRTMYELASMGDLGVLTPERLAKEMGDWVVVISPYDVMQDQFDGVAYTNGLKVIWSASFPYESEAKLFMGANNMWIKRAGGKFVADVDVRGQGGRVDRRIADEGILHVSGHANPMQIKKAISIIKPNTVVITHTDKPATVAVEMKKWFGEKIRIIWQMDTYSSEEPLKKPGFYLPL